MGDSNHFDYIFVKKIVQFPIAVISMHWGSVKLTICVDFVINQHSLEV